MKRIFRISLFITFFLLAVSCSSDSSDNSEEEKPDEELITDYNYNESEIEVMQLINKHRENIGLKTLIKVNYISVKCEEHTNYMIASRIVNHDNFTARSENIMKVLGAYKVGENVAYNYKTAEGVLIAWLASGEHKKNIEGDYTHFGIAIKIDAENGRKYYTNIFAKI
ncbi:CAP domain-containing protein [Flavobacterium sp.]|uniref:CAP domain-containing protein n=1 Tax=Flavobacterium sp. TaxID=239 RepID=UPI0032671598